MCIFIFNEVLIFQILSLVVLSFFISTYNILTLWYLAGIYLVLLGLLLLADGADIFIGFLWVIDLGVGLVFFIFILHYSTFLFLKSSLEKNSRKLLIICFSFIFLFQFYIFFSSPVDTNYTNGLNKSWFFLVSWYDYYTYYFAHTVTDLNLLREIFFYNNSFEFFIINLMLLYGILSAILMSFLIKRIFSFLNYSQLKNYPMFTKINSSFFIRNQDFIKQQQTSTGTRVWVKNKNLKKS